MQLLLPEEAAELLDMPVENLRRLCKKRAIRHYKIGRSLRFDMEGIEQFRSAKTDEPAEEACVPEQTSVNFGTVQVEVASIAVPPPEWRPDAEKLLKDAEYWRTRNPELAAYLLKKALRRPRKPREFIGYFNQRKFDQLASLIDTGRTLCDQSLYIIGASERARFVKIGRAKNPQKRLGDLQVGHPEKLKVLRAFPRAGDFESAFHDGLAEQRASGEWFRNCAALWKAVAYFEQVFVPRLEGE